MLCKILKSKIHRATITQTDMEYVGSLTIDEDLMEAAGIVPNECILVADLTNGSRHWTYAIAGQRGSGAMCANGAAAHLVQKGDRIIVMAFAYATAEEAAAHRPRVVLVNERNQPVRTL
jgi:aspartate 1-decarboxylase